MAVPVGVRFDRFAQMTGGLVQVSDEIPFLLDPDGMSLATGWLTIGDNIWSACYDPISTVWTTCYAAVVTTWTTCYNAVTTVWTRL